MLIASKWFSQEHTGCDQPKQAITELRNAGPETVIVTLGDQGGIGRANGRSFRFNAFAVEVVDTTGAGDVFHRAYIYGLLRGWSTERVIQFAAAVAAIKCTKLGGRAGIPDLKMTQEFLKRLFRGICGSFSGVRGCKSLGLTVYEISAVVYFLS